jgi:hypothetical protein
MFLHAMNVKSLSTSSFGLGFAIKAKPGAWIRPVNLPCELSRYESYFPPEAQGALTKMGADIKEHYGLDRCKITSISLRGPLWLETTPSLLDSREQRNVASLE